MLSTQSMQHFKVLRIHRQAKGIQGRLETSKISELDAGDIVIKSSYSSLNYKDALAITGHSDIIRKFPCVAGVDVAGYVTASKIKHIQEGDRVIVTGYGLGVTHDGGYSEYVRVPARWVVKLPPSMSLYESMALGTAGFTVALCVQRLEENKQLPEYGPFVITGATGGVGTLAIDIMNLLGYEIVAVSGKTDHLALLNELGAKRIINRDDIVLNDSPLDRAQWGGAIDNVGGRVLSWLARTIKPWGNIVSVGLAESSQFNMTVMPFILRGVSILGVTASACPVRYRQHLWDRLASDLKPRHLEKIVSSKIKLTDLIDAAHHMLARKKIGRTIVEINPE